MVLDLELSGFAGRVSLLDGGLPQWVANAGSLETGSSDSRGQRLGLQRGTGAGVLVDLDFVHQHLHDNSVVLVDARLPKFYSGAALEGPERRGHVPGAVNVPYPSVVDQDGKLLAPAELRARLVRVGITPAKMSVVYCHSGNKAALVYWALRWAGLPARVYEGSWVEWSREADLPVETGAGRRLIAH